MPLSGISLIFLLVAITIGYKAKLNTGLVAIGLALILGKMGGISDNIIISGFNGSLFTIMLGVSYLFSIAQQNKTLELVAKKIITLAGKRTNFIPIIIFFLAAFLAGIGPGTIPVMALMAVFTMSLSAEMKINPVMMASIGLLGAQGGGLTPIAPTGILGNTLAANMGIHQISRALMGGQFLGSLAYSTLLYIIFGGYKIKTELTFQYSEIDKFNKKQKITLLGILVMIFMVLILKINAGLASFLIATAIMLFKVADEKQVLAHVPWGTLILVTGVNVLMSVIIKLGGVNLLASGLSSIMGPKSAVPIMSITAGIMSWFSSTSGVVMPTLIPTVASIIEKMGGNLSAAEMITAIVTASHTAGVSPISTGGGLALAAYVSSTSVSTEEQQKLFNRMFAVAIGGVVFMSIFSFFGGFSIIK